MWILIRQLKSCPEATELTTPPQHKLQASEKTNTGAGETYIPPTAGQLLVDKKGNIPANLIKVCTFPFGQLKGILPAFQNISGPTSVTSSYMKSGKPSHTKD